MYDNNDEDDDDDAFKCFVITLGIERFWFCWFHLLHCKRDCRKM